MQGRTPREATCSAVESADGTGWVLLYDGVSCRCADRPGLRHLATLLSQPDKPVSALLLEQSCIASERGPCTRVGLHDARERARACVSDDLAMVIDDLGASHPRLAEHLRATVTTGTFCIYAPGGELPDATEDTDPKNGLRARCSA